MFNALDANYNLQLVPYRDSTNTYLKLIRVFNGTEQIILDEQVANHHPARWLFVGATLHPNGNIDIGAYVSINPDPFFMIDGIVHPPAPAYYDFQTTYTGSQITIGGGTRVGFVLRDHPHSEDFTSLERLHCWYHEDRLPEDRYNEPKMGKLYGDKIENKHMLKSL